MNTFLFVYLFFTVIVGQGKGLKCNGGIWYSKNGDPFNKNSIEEVLVDSEIEECGSFSTHCITYSGSVKQNTDTYDVKFLGKCVPESFCTSEQPIQGFESFAKTPLSFTIDNIDELEKPIIAVCCDTDACNTSEPPRTESTNASSSGKNVFGIFYLFQLFAVLKKIFA